MLKLWFHRVLVATLFVLPTGCGTPEGYFPVTGSVLYKGQPAAGAVVYFHGEAGSKISLPSIPYGIVEEDGSFTLACDGVGAGCPPGKYNVLVEWKELGGDGVTAVPSRGKTKLVKRSRVRVGPDRLKGRYFAIAKPLLHAEIKPEFNRLTAFELTD